MKSTFKLGIGANVQTKLKAVLHLDVPWRPADIGKRSFDDAEIKMLCDAVSAAHFITEKQTTELIKKLLKNVSVYTAKLIKPMIQSPTGSKVSDSSIYVADMINYAISNKKQIQFQYFEYNEKKDKIALNVGYKEYQHTEQNHDLDHIIDKKLHTSADFSACIKTEGVQQRADQPVQPFHTENFVLYEVPNSHKAPPFIDKLKSVDLFAG